MLSPPKARKIFRHSNGLGNKEKNLKIYGVSQLNKYLNRNKEFIFSLVEFFAVAPSPQNDTKFEFPALFVFIYN
jgi:hypothetical protein